jgi:hypothetical protein
MALAIDPTMLYSVICPYVAGIKETKSHMASLSDALLRPDVFPHVISDCQALVDQEVSAKGGLSGTAVKVAYKAVKSFAPGYYENALRNLVPELADRLDPYWTNFQAAGGGHFGDYLASRGPQVAESLLAVTDQMASTSSRAAVVKAYNAVRGGAAKNIEAALPNLGALVQKYAY